MEQFWEKVCTYGKLSEETKLVWEGIVKQRVYEKNEFFLLEGQVPRTVAFGDNYTLNVLDINRLLDIERFGRVDVNASGPETLYPDRALLAPELNVGFLKRSIGAFREVNFASQATGRIYARLRSGVPVLVDREALQQAGEDPGTYAALRVIAPGIFHGEGRAVERPQYLQGSDSSVTGPTLGEWGREPAAS